MQNEARAGMLAHQATFQGPLVFPAFALLFCAASVFAFEQWQIAPINGFWLDEYFSIWASDVTAPFSQVFTQRIWPDTNPPLYFSALYFVRLAIADPLPAMMALNIAALCLTGVVTCASARRNRLPILLWSACFSLFLLSGPALRFTAEGRSYLIGMCLTFTASWYYASLLYRDDCRVGSTSLLVIGILAALTHVFAAITCCGLATGLFFVAALRGRRDLYKPALALGLGAGLTTLLWMFFALQHVSNISWIRIDRDSLMGALWEVRRTTFGPWIVTVIAMLLAGVGMLFRATRDLALMFAIAFALLLTVPLLASLKVPMVTGRYWLIGAPALSVLISFTVWIMCQKGGGSGLRASVPVGSGAAFVVFFIASAIGGRAGTMELVKLKQFWLYGSSIAREFGQGCADASVAVLDFPQVYAVASGLPQTMFRLVDFDKPSVPPSSCKMIGWAEHLNMPLFPSVAGFTPENAPAEKLLDLFRLDIDASLVEIKRHPSGVIILKKDSATR